MKIIVPDYYPQFSCIAGACRHSCCRGWEIDIDEDSLARYSVMPGPVGEKLRTFIRKEEDGTAHFILQGKEERCPFLQQDGLCELIIKAGEESLCQICTDHPRFRNFWTNRTELGLGMACEAAARLILSREEKTGYIVLEDDGETEEESEEEQDLLLLRDDLTAILQDRSMPVDRRICRMLEYCGMDGKEPVFLPGPLNETACEQLAVYLMWRHFADALYDGRLQERVKFVADSYCRVRNAWAAGGSTDPEDLIESARAFSEDVEYDTDTWA